jgi:hypothetical protein
MKYRTEAIAARLSANTVTIICGSGGVTINYISCTAYSIALSAFVAIVRYNCIASRFDCRFRQKIRLAIFEQYSALIVNSVGWYCDTIRILWW